jgi:hypothetical protein
MIDIRRIQFDDEPSFIELLRQEFEDESVLNRIQVTSNQAVQIGQFVRAWFDNADRMIYRSPFGIHVIEPLRVTPVKLAVREIQ